ncbi:hypothetical protein ES705_37600 [subsurface metagenome]
MVQFTMNMSILHMYRQTRFGLLKEFDTILNPIPDQENSTGWSTDKLCKMCLLILLGLELNSSVVPLML